MAATSTQCRQIIYGASMRGRRCNRRPAKGRDGYCGHCWNTYHQPLPPTYTCTACWTVVRRGVDGPLCADHKAA